MNFNLSYIRRFFPLLIGLSGFIALYYNTIYKMVIDWTIDDNYSHGFLIPAIAGFLIWLERDRLRAIQVKPANSGLVPLAGSLAFYAITHIGAELFTMRFSMILVMLSATVFLAGWKMTKALLLPLLYLVFMIPLPAIIWNKIAFPLKLFATKLAVGTIKLLQISVYSEGNVIHLANTTLEVVDACSGLRSLTSLLALSAAFALICNHTLIKKWLLFLSAVPIAIFVNIVRLTVTAILSARFGEKAAQGFLHDMSGLLIFFLALVFLYAFHQLLSKIPFSNKA